MIRTPKLIIPGDKAARVDRKDIYGEKDKIIPSL